MIYIFQTAFLSGLSVCVFLIADFYSTDEASIRLMLVFLPWVAMILVPALSMSSWVEGQGNRGLELIFTMPISLPAIVLGKYISGYLVLLLTLIFTLPFVATVCYLGNPDFGVLISGYFGSFLILGLFLAVSLFGASIAREPVGAFVVSIILLFSFMLLGWDIIGRMLKGIIPEWVLTILVSFSPLTWLTYIGQGTINFQGLFYFISISSFCLAGTIWFLNPRRKGYGYRKNSSKEILKWLVGITLMFLMIHYSGYVPSQIDLTTEKEFTLHSGTIEVIERLPKGTKITLFWSESESSVPASIKSHARRIKNMLEGIKKQSDVDLKVVDPEPDSDEEIQALAKGISRVPMSSGDSFFLGLTAEYAERTGRVPYLDIRRDRLVEYDIALTLNGLTRQRTPKLGIISPMLPSTSAVSHPEGLSFLAELKRAYDIAVIPYFKKTLPQHLDAILVIGANIIHQDMLYAIDQFVMKGGSLLVMLDPFSRVKQGNNLVNAQPSLEINDVSDLIKRYGVTYLGDMVSGDSRLASVVTDQQQSQLSYPYWMRIRSQGLSSSHPATADLNEIFVVEAGALEITNTEHGSSIVTTSSGAGFYPREEFTNNTPRKLAQEFKPNGGKRIIAATLTGPFESAYKYSPLDEKVKVHRKNSKGKPIVFVIADVDWIFDPFSIQKQNFGNEIIVRPLNDNLNFLLNMVEYATGDDSLVAIRSRGQLQRPFTRVAMLFKDTEEKIRIEETQFSQEVAELETKLSEISPQTKGPDYRHLPDAIKEQLKELGKELLKAKKKLRNSRHKIREEVDRLGQMITIINLISGPFLVVGLALFVFFYRKAKMLNVNK